MLRCAQAEDAPTAIDTKRGINARVPQAVELQALCDECVTLLAVHVSGIGADLMHTVYCLIMSSAGCCDLCTTTTTDRPRTEA